MKKIRTAVYFLTIIVFLSLFNNLNAQKNLRTKKYSSRAQKEALTWQKELRGELFHLLKLADLVSPTNQIPFDQKVLSITKHKGYSKQEIEISSTPGRRIRILLTLL